MADSSLSSDLEPEASPPHKQAKCSKKSSGPRSGSSSRTSRKDKATPAQDKDALRRHKALEHQCDKAQKATAASLGLEECLRHSTSLTPRGQTPCLQGQIPCDNRPLTYQTQVIHCSVQKGCHYLFLIFQGLAPLHLKDAYQKQLSPRQPQASALPKWHYPPLSWICNQCSLQPYRPSWQQGYNRLHRFPFRPKLGSGLRSCCRTSCRLPTGRQILQRTQTKLRTAPRTLNSQRMRVSYPIPRPSQGCSAQPYSTRFFIRLV